MAVQRMALPGGAGAGPGRPATRMVHAAPSVVVQRATPAEPPPVELSTEEATDARSGGGANQAEMAEQVYSLLVRRLENERKQRGW